MAVQRQCAEQRGKPEKIGTGQGAKSQDRRVCAVLSEGLTGRTGGGVRKRIWKAQLFQLGSPE